jgi:hypothetical protein
VVAVVFLRLGRWQWEVAGSTGELDWQNAAYALQWVVFTGFVGWFWYKVMADQRLVEGRRAADAAEEERVD